MVPTYNDMPLPTDFTDHEGRVSGLALLKGNLLASISFDKTLRIWDLTTMKPVAVSGRGAHVGGGAGCMRLDARASLVHGGPSLQCSVSYSDSPTCRTGGQL